MKEAECGRKTEDCRVKITSPSPNSVSIISCLEIQERGKLIWLQQMTETSSKTENKSEKTSMMLHEWSLLLSLCIQFGSQCCLRIGSADPSVPCRESYSLCQVSCALAPGSGPVQVAGSSEGYQTALKRVSLHCCHHPHWGGWCPPGWCAVGSVTSLKCTTLCCNGDSSLVLNWERWQ